MNMKTRTILLWSGVVILIVAGIVTLSLSFGGSKKSDVTAVDAVYTNAALTVAAQQQTLQAGMPTPILLPSSTPLPSPTFQAATPISLPTLNLAATAPIACDVAVYVSDVSIPDGTTIPAGQSFTKTWKVVNKGSCAWTATYQLVFVSGDSLGGKATPIGKIVNPGETADVSVVLTSSSAPGTITGTWRLANDAGQTFGDGLTVVINSGVAATKGDIIEETATEAPTATEVPTEAPIATEETPTP